MKTLFYLEPGTGSLVLQLAIATLAGLGIILASAWNRIKRFLTRKRSAIEEEQD